MKLTKQSLSETLPLFFANVVHSVFRLHTMKSLIRFYALIWQILCTLRNHGALSFEFRDCPEFGAIAAVFLNQMPERP